MPTISNQEKSRAKAAEQPRYAADEAAEQERRDAAEAELRQQRLHTARKSDTARATPPTGPPALPAYVRFRDIKAAGIASSYQAVLRLIESSGFPEGVLLGPNTRAWDREAVLAWLSDRPTERKLVPPRRPQQQTAAAAER